MSRKHVLRAATELEDIAVIAKQMCSDLRAGAPDPYARLYWLRRRLSRVMSQFPEGGRSALKSGVADEYEAYLQSL